MVADASCLGGLLDSETSGWSAVAGNEIGAVSPNPKVCESDDMILPNESVADLAGCLNIH